jgi:hypothetical protein
MEKIIGILKKIDEWLLKAGNDMYPNLTKHMKKKE